MKLRAIANPWGLAAAILASSMMATFANAQSTSESQLQSLVNDTAFQLKLSYRFNVAELTQRREEVGKTIAAWNESTRNQADNQKLADWLRGAIRASMPGSKEQLPPLPKFVKPAAIGQLPLPDAPATTKTTTADGQPTNAATPSSATEHTLMRPNSTTTDAEEAALSEEAKHSEPNTSAEENFWSDHPASEDLPDDLSKEDPFRDDPLPTDDDLFFE